MAWPTVAVSTTNCDAGTDVPATFRADVLDAIQKLNAMIGSVANYGFSVVGDIGLSLPSTANYVVPFVKSPVNYTNLFVSDPSNLFNISTNVFTAPVAGWYEFNYSGGFYSATGGSTNAYAYFQFKNNTTGKWAMFAYGDKTGTAALGPVLISGSGLLYCAANDTVSVNVNMSNTGGATASIGPGSVFSGKYLGNVNA
jgi:hypothetical protein